MLFPGAAMPLHIFEPRYRKMVEVCLEQDGSFGLIHHDWDESGPFLGEKDRVGTVAEIARHRPLPDGRSLILVRGDERFAIAREVGHADPYFEAAVKPYRDGEPEDRSRLLARRRRSLELFRAVLESVSEAESEPPGWSAEEEVSFRLAETVEVPASWQQALLELRSEERRLDRLDVVFRAALEAC